MASRDIKPAARRIMDTYANNTGRQLAALQILFDTMIEKLKIDMKTEAAEEVCQHLHDGPPTQPVRCGDCVDIELAQIAQQTGGEGVQAPLKSREDQELEAEVLRLMQG